MDFPGTSAVAQSKTKGKHWLMDISGGWKADGFTETGAGEFNATVRSQSARSLRTQFGLEMAVAVPVGSVVIRPRLRGAWIHELANDHRSINASFGAIDYSVETRDPQRDSARLSAGFDVAINPTVARIHK